jgi:hypothetical protein
MNATQPAQLIHLVQIGIALNACFTIILRTTKVLEAKLGIRTIIIGFVQVGLCFNDFIEVADGGEIIIKV